MPDLTPERRAALREHFRYYNMQGCSTYQMAVREIVALLDAADERDRLREAMREPCPACYGTGQWESACCNGSGGCDCRGELVPMGACHVCHGSGRVGHDADLGANVRSIAGMCYLGSGPR